MAVWPETLPDNVLLDGYKETFPDNLVRISMGTGPEKVRRRTTTQVIPFTCSLSLTSDLVDTLRTFYVTTLEGGSLSFTWTHPRDETSAIFRFLGPPTVTPFGPGNYMVNFGLEIIP